MNRKIGLCAFGVLLALAASLLQAAPMFQASGAAQSGTGAVTVSWPAHAVGDVALLFVESAGGEPVTLSAPSSFVAVANSPQATGTGTAGTRLSVFWARATSIAMPAVVVADPGNHVVARIFTYRGVINSGDPWDVTGGGVKAAASTAVSVSGVTTATEDTLVVQAVSRDNDSASTTAFSGQTNGNLNALAERGEAGTNSGNGGGFAVWDGVKLAAGAIGNTTATVTSSVNAWLTIALKPAPGVGAVIASAGNCSNQAGVGTIVWATPANAYVSDNLYATASNVTPGTTTNYLKCTGFDFSTVPLGAEITGITVYVERKTSGGTIRDAFVYLVKGDVIQTAVNRATATNYTTADVVEAHGAADDLWANTWTVTDIQSPNFGVVFSARNAGATPVINRTVSVDHIYARISYIPSSLHHVGINAPTSAMALSEVPVTVTPHTVAHASIAGAGSLNFSSSTGAGDWTLISGSGTLTLGAPDSGLATYTFGGGETSAVLGFTSQTAGTVTLGVTDAFGLDMLLNAPAGEKANVITFSAASFVFTSSACLDGVAFGTPGQCAKIAWSPRIAGQALASVYITSVNTAGVPARLHATQDRTRDLQFGLTCHNPAANAGLRATFTATAETLPLCQSNGAIPAVWTTPVTLTFAGGVPSVGPYSFNYDDVGQVEFRLRNSAATAEMGSSGAFVVKPANFLPGVIRQSALPNKMNPAAVNAAGDTFVKAGEAFTVVVSVLNAAGAATPNFGKETPTAETVKLTPTLVSGLGLTHNPSLSGSFGGFTGGVAQGTAFKWDEVGIITLTPSVGDGDYLSGGDVTGTPSANVGRFYLDHFIVQNAVLEDRGELCEGGVLVSDGVTACAPAFTYMGEQLTASFTLAARSANNLAVQNYVDSATAASDWAKLDPALFADLSFGAVDSATAGGPYYLTARISNSGMPAAACASYPCFQLGGAQAEADVSAALNLSRGASPDGPYGAVEIGISPQDADGATVSFDLDVDGAGGNDHASLGTTAFRYGRMKIANVLGSNLADMLVTATAQYWDGGKFVANGDDCLTTLSLPADIALSNWQGLPAGATTVAGGVLRFQNGANCGYTRLTLSKPGTGKSGRVDVDVSTGAAAYRFLPGAKGVATFGVYDGSQSGRKDFIYLRESY